MKKHLGWVALTVVAVTGVAAYTQVGRSDTESIPITARVTRGSIVDKVDATGTIQPVTTVQVGTPLWLTLTPSHDHDQLDGVAGRYSGLTLLVAVSVQLPLNDTGAFFVPAPCVPVAATV